MKCKSCGAEIAFDPKLQKLKCDYCGAEFDPKEYELDAKEGVERTSTEVSEDKVIELKQYTCTQCGATLMVFDDTAVTFCSYCGSNIVIEPKLCKESMPDYVIPFKITKEQCAELYKKAVKKFLFTPKYMKEDSEIQKFRGIYMPYGVYKTEHHGPQVNAGERYSHRSGDYVYYDLFTITCNIEAEFNGIAFDLASRFEDKFSEAISPFDFNQAVPFDVHYLSGFYADSIDVDKNLYSAEARTLATPIAGNILIKYPEFSRYGCLKPICTMNVTDAKIAYYPVYFLAIKNKNNSISYAVVNGQTGEVAVEMPTDFKKYVITSIFATIPFFFMFYFISAKYSFMASYTVYASIFFLLISMILNISQTKRLNNTKFKLDDKGFMFANKGINVPDKDKYHAHIIPHVICLVLCVASIVLNYYSNDNLYYGAAIISFVCVMLSYYSLIKKVNLLTSRKLEQLGKRGGDENA